MTLAACKRLKMLFRSVRRLKTNSAAISALVGGDPVLEIAC
jgi:hypothetical protein